MERHREEVRAQAIKLIRSGVSNAEAARRLGVPVGTVSYWLHMDRSRRGECPGRPDPKCPRCHGRDLDEAAYVYLLGLYLGDGHIIQYSQHRVPSLMITCGDDWPGLMDACEAAMQAVFPDNSVCRVKRTGCQNVKIYSKHLWCMFPQHGPGKKHEREIALEAWQQKIVDAHPWELIRGLVHSDGCRITNWATKVVAGERKRYEYTRYFFTNKSDDIRKLFSDTLDKVGVEWKMTRRGTDPFNISVARRDSVALMDLLIGPKY
ncbi:helix-turn-helix domain-containing protein [Streptomyces sp. AV19]|uniref:helix-turn-helix domain-containing protein n=1 Tax=Streptomyces sp. AV19 TaxID=2793068 RepID=UPI0018FE8B50|nr:helix-turn-helix domain-containing protein [Streptomyces sp. AV19]MBH1936333.1 helix-turn-helix domain-containing protein [Streptomyces sp. AV19]MDG4532370.1 helix-turn-helix domain-containing protein [Streptomyces sp. AV19]